MQQYVLIYMYLLRKQSHNLDFRMVQSMWLERFVHDEERDKKFFAQVQAGWTTEIRRILALNHFSRHEPKIECEHLSVTAYQL